MSAPNKSQGREGGPRRRRRDPPRDLIDFYRRWSDFRDVATGLAGRADISAIQKSTLNWLILLADRVGENDLRPLDRKPPASDGTPS
ncbi:hypothetical protein HL666_25260 [Bradyrhizobium sp. 83002]|uniref:hypothetical protein n=1 Tax=Bradyrhizobium aeschynomenes TaxID=2734909 RepID=UPI001556998E|nr:hypothetical protein [Bradyrhizobium aeschynomenes]NPU14081.1 hypothetical protein [Bradyrhizobium aeschynomenes]NPV24139.1 hypothetical protein [Bradyrhizobium aeschynomenes]